MKMDGTLGSGKYSIEGEIARGGMGILYKATHTDLHRPVAIKALHSTYEGDPTFLKRFEREARAMARMDHENIIRVFDVGKENGIPYIVMELFEGKDLRRLISERGRYTLREALQIALQVANALAYAHYHGVIHRDIKPGNILVNRFGKVKISDFGIAAATDENSVTSADQIVGTPEYMSPEQARGAQLNGRTDLYSLGIVIYEMLNGKTPFTGLSKIAIVGKLLYDQGELHSPFPADIPDSVQDCVRCLLKRQQQDRIADATTLVTRLKKLETDLGVTPKETSVEKETIIQTVESPYDPAAPDVVSADDTVCRPPAPIRAPTPPVVATLPPLIDPPMAKTVPVGAGPVTSPLVIAPAQKRPALFRRVAGAILVLLAGSVVYIAISRFDSKSERPKEPDPLLAEVQTLQAAILKIQHQIAKVQSSADASGANQFAPQIYKQAQDLKDQGSNLIQEGIRLSNDPEQYPSAKARLEKALERLTSAHEAFALAGNASEEVKAKESDAAGTAQTLALQTQDRLSKAKAAADKLSAEALVRQSYRKAKALQTQGAEAYQKGVHLSGQREYKAALGRFKDAKTLWEQAHTQFDEAGKTAWEAKKTAEAVSQQRLESLARSVRAMQDRADQARSLAQTAGARELEFQRYNQADNLRNQGVEAYQEGIRLFKPRRYQEAEGLLEKAQDLFRQADDLFGQATHAARQINVDWKRADQESVEKMLQQLEAAYNRKDLAALRRMSEMSPETNSLLQQLFGSFSAVRMKIRNVSIMADSVSAEVWILELVKPNGDVVRPGKAWEKTPIAIRKQSGNRWGKVIWSG